MRRSVHLVRDVVLAIGLVATFTVGNVRAQDPTRLAERCQAIPWRVPPGAADTVPPGLRHIQRELVDAGRGSLPAIVTAGRQSLHLRRIAPEVVARWPGDATRTLLLELLRDTDEIVAAGAADGLARVGGREVLPALLDATQHRSARVRHDALNALAHLGAADRACAAALRLLTDKEPSVRHSAVDLLGRVEGRRHVQTTLDRLSTRAPEEPDARVRKAIQRTVRILRARREDRPPGKTR